MQTNILHTLETFLLRGPVDTAKILGVSYSNYAAMKAGTRPIQPYVQLHAETLMELDSKQLHKVVKGRLSNGG